MRLLPVFCLLPAQILFPAVNGSLSGLNPGDYVSVEYRWRNVDVPPTSSACPYVTAQDATGKTVFRRLLTNLGRRGFVPEDCSTERWQVNFLVDGGPVPPPPDPESAYSKLPSNTVAVTAYLSEKGDPAVREGVKITVSRKKLKPRPRTRRPALEWEGRELTDKELDEALAVREKAKAEVYRDGDRTLMRLNGKPFMPCIYKCTRFRSQWKHRIAEAFKGNGFNVLIVPLMVGGCDTPEKDAVWRADGSVDISRIRAELRNYLRWNPDANLIVDLVFQPPRGWGESNPSELFRNENGEYGYWHHNRIRAYGKTPAPPAGAKQSPTPSYASAAFSKAMADVLERVCADFERAPEGKAVIGMFFGGGTDGQWLDQFDNGVKPWQMADYSDVARRRYTEYLKKKYGTVENLNRAYGRTGIASFSDVQVPSTKELTSESIPYFRIHGDTPQSDYRGFLADVAAEMWLTAAKAVKKASGRRLLFGGYAPHGGLSGYPLFSQSASGTLMNSPDMDFFAVVPGYLREFCDPIRSAVFDGTMSRRGKLFIRELDLRSVDSRQFWGRWKEPFWQETHSDATFRRKVMHYAADAIVHGGVYHAYDMDGGWYNSADDQQAWKLANRMASAARSEPLNSERIALVGGERYCRFYSSQRGRGMAYPLLEHLPKALQRSGVQWNAYLIDDVLKDRSHDLPKVVLLSEVSSMTAAEFREFRSRYCRDGRVVVYFWRPGLFADDGAEIDRLLSLNPAGGMSPKKIMAAKTAKDPLTEGLKGIFAACHSESPVSEVATASGEGWSPLMYFEGTDTPGVSVRRGKDFTEVYIALPGAITARFCRNLAKEAGFAPLVESDELSGCGSGIFYMVAQSDGKKRFRLPAGRVPGEVLLGDAFVRLPDGTYSVTMETGEIFVLSYR